MMVMVMSMVVLVMVISMMVMMKSMMVMVTLNDAERPLPMTVMVISMIR